MRNYTENNSSEAQKYLEIISNTNTGISEYKDAMFELGKSLGAILKKKIVGNRAKICLACTVEDADFLSKGILDVLESQFEIKLVCFWNNRLKENGIQAAPIIKRYNEGINAEFKHVIIVKSIISGSCVVRTNLSKLLESINAENIYVVAPVIFDKAEENLKHEFPQDIADKFEMIYFACDSEKDENGNVLPGIGGDVYQRLGFKNQDDKNTYIPELVKSRRKNLVY